MWVGTGIICELNHLYVVHVNGMFVINNWTCSSLTVLADTPPPAYMPPDEQLGQESQSMDTTSSLVPPNLARGGEENM